MTRSLKCNGGSVSRVHLLGVAVIVATFSLGFLIAAVRSSDCWGSGDGHITLHLGAILRNMTLRVHATELALVRVQKLQQLQSFSAAIDSLKASKLDMGSNDEEDDSAAENPSAQLVGTWQDHNQAYDKNADVLTNFRQQQLYQATVRDQMRRKQGNLVKLSIKISDRDRARSVMIEVHPDWAPGGANRFMQLVSSGYYRQSRFHRVVPGFVAHFGIGADPKVNQRWEGKPINDDPVTVSNRAGTLTFAQEGGRNTRRCSVFVNLNHNKVFDSMGYAPFASVKSGYAVFSDLYSGYADSPVDERLKKEGLAYLQKQFPLLSYVADAELT